MFSILQVALDTQVWADAADPRFVEIVGPYKKWGGDNTDAFYVFAPVDPARPYRVRGNRGDCVYFSLTVYGGPRDGRYSERIVGSINDRSSTSRPTASSRSGSARDGPRATTARSSSSRTTRSPPSRATTSTTRSRTAGRVAHRGPRSAVDLRENDADLARRFRAAATWFREQSSMVPLPLGEPNHIDPPYPVPKQTFGWAAGDAAYAMGSFELAPDEALVIHGRSPECAFWNLCLWNPFMHTYNYDYERVTINGAKTVLDADGSWTIVVAEHDPGVTQLRLDGRAPAGPGLVPVVLPVGDAGAADDPRRPAA